MLANKNLNWSDIRFEQTKPLTLLLVLLIALLQSVLLIFSKMVQLVHLKSPNPQVKTNLPDIYSFKTNIIVLGSVLKLLYLSTVQCALSLSARSLSQNDSNRPAGFMKQPVFLSHTRILGQVRETGKATILKSSC